MDNPKRPGRLSRSRLEQFDGPIRRGRQPTAEYSDFVKVVRGPSGQLGYQKNIGGVGSDTYRYDADVTADLKSRGLYDWRTVAGRKRWDMEMKRRASASQSPPPEEGGVQLQPSEAGSIQAPLAGVHVPEEIPLSMRHVEDIGMDDPEIEAVLAGISIPEEKVGEFTYYEPVVQDILNPPTVASIPARPPVPPSISAKAARKAAREQEAADRAVAETVQRRLAANLEVSESDEEPAQHGAGVFPSEEDEPPKPVGLPPAHKSIKERTAPGFTHILSAEEERILSADPATAGELKKTKILEAQKQQAAEFLARDEGNPAVKIDPARARQQIREAEEEIESSKEGLIARLPKRGAPMPPPPAINGPRGFYEHWGPFKPPMKPLPVPKRATQPSTAGIPMGSPPVGQPPIISGGLPVVAAGSRSQPLHDDMADVIEGAGTKEYPLMQMGQKLMSMGPHKELAAAGSDMMRLLQLKYEMERDRQDRYDRYQRSIMAPAVPQGGGQVFAPRMIMAPAPPPRPEAKSAPAKKKKKKCKCHQCKCK